MPWPRIEPKLPCFRQLSTLQQSLHCTGTAICTLLFNLFSSGCAPVRGGCEYQCGAAETAAADVAAAGGGHDHGCSAHS